MNKTVNINLGGIFFYIDEDAYQKLSRYFDAIKRSLNKSAGQDEIIRDIEMRIAELVSEKHTHPKQVISIKEIEEVITIMGQPEDYRIDDGETPQPDAPFYSSRSKRKLYRDRENGIIGGVLSGLGHYFGIDKVWLRVLFVILLCFFGTGIIAYIIMWIIMPEAVTTTEKLEMRGEPITISNIERKVREEIEGVSERIRNADYGRMGDDIHRGATKVGSTIGDVFIAIFRVFAKIIGAFLILVSLSTLVALLIGVFTLGTSAFIHFPWQSFVEEGNFDHPVWLFGLVMFFAVGIPFFYLCLLGFKLLAPKIKSPGPIVNFGLLGVWVIATAVAVSFAIGQVTAFAFDGKSVKREQLALNPADTLKIRFTYNENYANSVEHNHTEFRLELDDKNNEKIYSNNVWLRIERTDDAQAYIQIERIARGSSMSEAKRTAEKIEYGYKFENNTLILDNYLLTDFRNKFRDQHVDVILYLPKGILFRPDRSVQQHDGSYDEYFNLHWSDDSYTYRVDKDKVRCLDCPPEEDEEEYDDAEEGMTITTTATDSAATTTKVSVGINGVKVEQTTTEGGKGLTKDKDGNIIKK